MGNFVKDLRDSQWSVNHVKAFLEPYFDLKQNNDKRWDLEVYLKETNRRMYTIEVKNDLMWQKTGNVAIEYWSRNKPSGIATSEADYWYYVLGEEVWVCATEVLRDKLSKGRYREVVGGDDKTSGLYLLKMAQFKELFTKLETGETKEGIT